MKTLGFWKKQEKEIILHKNKMNIIESCLDRHTQNPEMKDVLALSVEDEKAKLKQYTYSQLDVEVNKFANLLK